MIETTKQTKNIKKILKNIKEKLEHADTINNRERMQTNKRKFSKNYKATD